MRVAWVLGLTAAITAAQQVDEVRVTAHLYTPPQPHISARTNLVQMEVVVRDPRGHAEGGMTRTATQPAGSTRGFIREPVDAGGNMVAAKEGDMELALKDATLGLNAPPGGYMVRVVLQDADGEMAAQNQTVMISK